MPPFDGTVPSHKRWDGGPQSYFCAALAPYYVKRNFSRLKAEGIRPDAAYLDVFTCNEGDECSNPRHRMARRECYGYCNLCFDYPTAGGIFPGSEEVSDWSVKILVFCHYAPYDCMLRRPGMPRQSVPAPLFNPVYHDCLVVPWRIDRKETEDYMLYALLNGGAPYLIREGACPDFDGSFETGFRKEGDTKLLEEVKRCETVSRLHEKVAECELLRYELADGDPSVQKSVFSEGTEVAVDFNALTYRIVWGQ